jgi:hypothetical protein
MKNINRVLFMGFVGLAALFLAACNATLPAGAEAKISADGKSAQVEFTGVVDSIAADQWVIAGQTVLVNTQTVIDGTFAAGDTVKVEATVTKDGAVTANKIESPSASGSGSEASATPEKKDNGSEFTGAVESIGPDAWTVGGQVFTVNSQTEIKGNILVGDMVKVHFVVNPDGTSTATEIGPVDDKSQGSGSNDQETHELTGKVDAFSTDSWTVNGQVFAVTAQTEIKDQILLGDVVKVHYVTNLDGTFTSTEIELAGKNQAHNSEKKLTGVLQDLSSTQATIDGVIVMITPQTELDNGLIIGQMVKAEVVTNPDGTMTALQIKSANNSKSGKDNGGDSGKSGSGNGGSENNHSSTPQPGGEDHHGDD